MHIKDVYRIHRNEIDKLDSLDQKTACLAELNVIEKVRNVCHLSIIQNSWQQANGPTIMVGYLILATGYWGNL